MSTLCVFRRGEAQVSSLLFLPAGTTPEQINDRAAAIVESLNAMEV
jgi:hypothetical protein